MFSAVIDCFFKWITISAHTSCRYTQRFIRGFLMPLKYCTPLSNRVCVTVRVWSIAIHPYIPPSVAIVTSIAASYSRFTHVYFNTTPIVRVHNRTWFLIRFGYRMPFVANVFRRRSLFLTISFARVERRKSTACDCPFCCVAYCRSCCFDNFFASFCVCLSPPRVCTKPIFVSVSRLSLSVNLCTVNAAMCRMVIRWNWFREDQQTFALRDVISSLYSFTIYRKHWL